MAEERSRMVRKHMVLFSPQQSLPVHRNTCTYVESGVIGFTYLIKGEEIKSAWKAFITLISPGTRCVLMISLTLSALPFTLLCLQHLLISKQPFAILRLRVLLSGGIQLCVNWCQTFGFISPSNSTYGCDMLTLMGRKGRKYTARCVVQADVLKEKCFIAPEKGGALEYFVKQI